jgi:hypothetical protein
MCDLRLAVLLDLLLRHFFLVPVVESRASQVFDVNITVFYSHLDTPFIVPKFIPCSFLARSRTFSPCSLIYSRLAILLSGVQNGLRPVNRTIRNRQYVGRKTGDALQAAELKVIPPHRHPTPQHLV